jgi:alkanesulfonate monooxygenase SsuD/methylene tetrahydromethanopterin reductase-like flavin-dependent oxidoreductase (luciferase family)
MTALGAVFLPQLPPERLRSVALAAEEAGLAELWLWEDCFRESGVASAAAALAWTDRLRVGVGLMPVPLRNVALTAMEVATLLRMFPGRLRVGVGHGMQEWMGQVGARVESPLTLLREYVIALRALLAGERVSGHGRYVRLDRVALDWPPPAAPEILVGAIGSSTMHLCGEVADGAILTAETTPAEVRQARDLLAAGQRADGRGGPHSIVVYTQTPAAARDVEAAAGAVAGLIDAGADTVVFQPSEDEPDPEAFIQFVASEVQPAIQ